VATPGHTPGHTAFLFREEGVLFMGDYDLTAFGPWYGDTLSSIRETLASVERLRRIPARTRLTGHETGVFETAPDDLWDRYTGVIGVREARLMELLAEPKTLEEIAGAWIVYGKRREPEEFFAFGERAIMKKHLEQLTAQGRVVAAGPRWVRAERG
jgi:glyoxylase-like metal-dependent hydrolase (beta-lactamase superfamily II)